MLAFNISGTKTILMSLWKVADNDTQELMEYLFKEKLNGIRIRVAFKIAKDKIRTKYPDPYYWGAFIIIEEQIFWRL